MRWKHLKTRSLSKELTASLMLLVFLFEGILLAVVYRVQSNAALAQLQEHADQTIVNLAEVLAVPIWDFDDEQIAKIGRGYVVNELVDEIRITDAEDRALYQASSKRISARQISRNRAIFHRDRRIGEVELTWSLDAYYADLLWLRNVILMILGGSLIVIFIATGLLLRIFMRRPLNLLQQGIDRVAQGEFDYRFDKIRHSELTGIAQRFSQMADVVRNRETALQQEVAERRRAEEKTRESEAKTRALLDALPDIMFRMDANGVFLEYRGATQELHVTDSFLNRKVDEVVPAELARRIHRHLEAALRERQIQIFEYELKIRGRRRHFECRLVAVGADQAVAIIRDITDRIKATAERRRLEEKLRQAQKMEAIGTLAGGVAHDLNNVLSGLVSYPELLLMDLPADSPLQGPIRTIQRSGEKAANIVQDLLTLARRGVSVAETVHLNDVIREYLQSPEFEKLKAYHPKCEIELQLDPELLAVRGSPVHLSKMIMNLVSNAAEALKHRGRIQICTENRFVEDSDLINTDLKPGDTVVLQVSDDGIGISPEDIERIFEPFYTKKAMGRSGTGLGMSVVWGTVKDHQGHIEVTSDVGLGTCFTVYLPAFRETRPKARLQYSMESLRATDGETVLVVDDMPDQLEIASNMLSRLGYRVLTAADGLQALALLKTETVDLVVLDMIMEPGIDGLDTYRRILQIRPGQKAVIASGFSESDRVKQAQAIGAGAYIKKPYRLEQIAGVVREELNRAK